VKVVSGKHFFKVLEKHGWVLKRTTKSSHFIYIKPGHPATISVPVHGHKDLKKGLQVDSLSTRKENCLELVTILWI
jgi:predicted RNA binding protein YcfA (HicA-like mRNA interferase family)